MQTDACARVHGDESTLLDGASAAGYRTALPHFMKVACFWAWMGTCCRGNMWPSLPPVRQPERGTGRHSSRRLEHVFPPDMTVSGFWCRSRHTRRGTGDTVFLFLLTGHGGLQHAARSVVCHACSGQRLCHTNFVNLNVNGTHAGIPHLVPAR